MLEAAHELPKGHTIKAYDFVSFTAHFSLFYTIKGFAFALISQSHIGIQLRELIGNSQ